jgi:hypothetical protein
MSYVAKLERCKRFGKGLILEDGLFIQNGEVQAYYFSIPLGKYKVENVAKNLENFQREIEPIRKARIEDIKLAASLGSIIIHSPSLKEIVENLAKKYFS